MSNYQHNKNVNYNQSPYSKPSMHSKFDNRQSAIGGGTRARVPHQTVPNTRGRGRGSNTSSRRGTNTSSRRGYGYVGKKNTRSGYQKHELHDSDAHILYNNRDMNQHQMHINNSSNSRRYERNPKIYTTKSKYRRSEIIKDKISENEIRIEGNGSIKEYVDYALNLFNNKTHPLIRITAAGRAISKAINCVEMIKRKQYGLHQESRIKISTMKEIWIPLEQCLKKVIIEREKIFVEILLTFDNKLVNINNIGYQEPISWIDLGDARELHDKMKGKMNKLQNEFDIQETAMNKQTDDYNHIIHKFNTLQNKYDAKESEYSDIKYLYDTQETEMNKQTNNYEINMNKLQNKYDLQEENYTNMKGKYNKQEIRMNEQKNDYNLNMNKLQNKYDSQESALANIQHKYDEQEEMNDLRMDKLGDKYDVKQGQFEDMENKYDIQIEQMKENKEKFDFLQNKYNTLQKHSNDRDENVRLKQNKYDNLNAKELVDVIVSLNEKRYQKYKDGLVKKFIEEGVDGSCLNQLTKDDLYGFGITNYKDKIAIYKLIKQLFK